MSSETGLDALGEAVSWVAAGRGEAEGDCTKPLVATGELSTAAGVADLEPWLEFTAAREDGLELDATPAAGGEVGNGGN